MSQTAADICRERGWGKGTLLHVHRSPWDYVIRITAVGEDHVLYKPLGHRYRGSEWTQEEGFEKGIFRFGELCIPERGDGMHAIPHLPWEQPPPPPTCHHCKQPGSIDHAGLCDPCSRALSEFNLKKLEQPTKEEA